MDLTVPRILIWQFLTGMALATAVWLIFDRVAGYSALLGSLICLIPNAFLALRLSVPRKSPGAAALMSAAWIGELGKLALTILFFSLVFTLVRPLSAAALFAGFIATQFVTLFGFLMRSNQEMDTRNSNGS